jgi:SHS2 domain-containing protein
VFQFFDHTGDIGIDIDAPDLRSVFADAAGAFSETITDRDSLPRGHTVEISLAAEAADLLLVEWLSELLFRFETEGWLSHRADVDVSQSASHWTLRGRLAGGRIDPERHTIRVLVKAVTYHALEVRPAGDRWHARVILDI